MNLAETYQSEGVSPVSFTLIAPDNTLVRVRDSPASASKTTWKPGDMVYIYQNGGGLYYVTDNKQWMDTQPTSVRIPSGGPT